MPSHRDEELFIVFSTYANFGGGARASVDIGEIDNARFAKLCKECNVIDSSITTTEVDIQFNKHKDKGARKLSFGCFKRAIQELAEKKYKGKLTAGEADAYAKLVNVICMKGVEGPNVNATATNTKGTIYDKLTDTSKYTGTHKNRFDENGKGKGMSGRVEMSEKRKNDFGSRPAVNASLQSLTNKGTRASESMSSIDKLHAKVPTNDKGTKKMQVTSKTIGKSEGSVFDRLTDVSTYKGTHQHRFNADGTGRGIAGRDGVAKGAGTGHNKYKGGDVKSLSQILRQ